MSVYPKECVFDFETASLADLKVVGARKYAEDNSTEILCLSFEYQGDVLTWTPDMGMVGVDHPVTKKLLALVLDPEVVFIAHGAGFEKSIWRCIMVEQYGFPDIPNNRWHDTMAVAAMKALPQDLETALDVTSLGAGKDMEGRRLTVSLSKLDRKGNRLVKRTPEIMSRVYNYCEHDVRDERMLHNYIGGFQRGERKVWLLDQRINERGVRLDLNYIDACQKIVDEASVPLLKEFSSLTGGLKLMSPKLVDWCKAEGYYVPNMQKQTIAEVLGHDIDGEEPDGATDPSAHRFGPPEHVRRVLEIRQLAGSSSVKKLARMRACANADQRARYLLQYHGAGPGRWAGRILQPHNFPRPTLRDDTRELVSPELIVKTLLTADYMYVQETLGPPIETVVSGLRHALVAAKKTAFVSGDYTQIEARIVLALAGQYDKIELFKKADRGEIDPTTGKPFNVYCDMAASIYRHPVDKKKDPEEYQTGKNTVLGLGFQMGVDKFASRYAQDQPREFSEGVVKTYRTSWAPQVPKLWAALEEAACATVWTGVPHEAYGVRYEIEGDWLTARLPSGRKLYYYHPRPAMKEMPWSTKEDPDIRQSWHYYVMKTGVWKRIDAYGGLLTENVVQALARDVLVHSMFKLEEEGYPLVLTVHDENLGEVPEARVDEKAFADIMRDGPAWAQHLRVPINVETWVGERYRK